MQTTHEQALVGVIGCGYVGLSVVVGAARAGMRVLGVDSAPDRLAQLSAGMPTPDVDVTTEELQSLIAGGLVRFDESSMGNPMSSSSACPPRSETANPTCPTSRRRRKTSPATSSAALS